MPSPPTCPRDGRAGCSAARCRARTHPPTGGGRRRRCAACRTRTTCRTEVGKRGARGGKGARSEVRSQERGRARCPREMALRAARARPEAEGHCHWRLPPVGWAWGVAWGERWRVGGEVRVREVHSQAACLCGYGFIVVDSGWRAHRESQSARSWLPVPFSEKRFPAYALVRGHDMRDENGVSLCTW